MTHQKMDDTLFLLPFVLMRILSHSKLRTSTPFVGIQYLVDFFECQNIPTTTTNMKDIMVHAAKLTGATIVESVFHEYNPYGLSGVVIIAESHFAIHTWPEYKVASVDLFSCGKINPEPGLEYIKKVFAAKLMKIRKIERGIVRKI